MKVRVSATIEKETARMLDEILGDETLNFRNSSHAIEYCIKKFWGEKHGKFRK